MLIPVAFVLTIIVHITYCFEALLVNGSLTIIDFGEACESSGLKSGEPKRHEGDTYKATIGSTIESGSIFAFMLKKFCPYVGFYPVDETPSTSRTSSAATIIIYRDANVTVKHNTEEITTKPATTNTLFAEFLNYTAEATIGGTLRVLSTIKNTTNPIPSDIMTSSTPKWNNDTNITTKEPTTLLTPGNIETTDMKPEKSTILSNIALITIEPEVTLTVSNISENTITTFKDIKPLYKNDSMYDHLIDISLDTDAFNSTSSTKTKLAESITSVTESYTTKSISEDNKTTLKDKMIVNKEVSVYDNVTTVTLKADIFNRNTNTETNIAESTTFEAKPYTTDTMFTPSSYSKEDKIKTGIVSTTDTTSEAMASYSEAINKISTETISKENYNLDEDLLVFLETGITDSHNKIEYSEIYHTTESYVVANASDELIIVMDVKETESNSTSGNGHHNVTVVTAYNNDFDYENYEAESEDDDDDEQPEYKEKFNSYNSTITYVHNTRSVDERRKVIVILFVSILLALLVIWASKFLYRRRKGVYVLPQNPVNENIELGDNSSQ